ncbi:transcriptional regulator [Cereibacter sphaeroides]|uniref:transcriptional regulator n=1 Tax=Cereibacter sphaeroides TaxID=1063 RepID=UPI001F1903A0|nr:transcriptional regulator [Cereibacter sphaeroides]MCE6958816.1 transcriptional regulator [Cereibacter sphaeroides]MCE6973310.1 transcriptional regulator [Cereibacter sphaeroides]
MSSICASQIRAARGLLDWSQDHLAQQAGVGICSVRRIERDGPGSRRSKVVERLTDALQSGGIIFIPRGVKLRSDIVPPAQSSKEICP